MRAVEAAPITVSALFKTREFIIPDYQRPYSWTEEQCEQLFDDLRGHLDCYKKGSQYFLGTIVVHAHEGDDNTWVVIDGQQRLTTLMVLLAVLFHKTQTVTVLEKLIYKTSSRTGEANIDEPRIVSKVIQENGDPTKDLLNVLNEKLTKLNKKNLLRANYEYLRDRVTKWWEGRSTGEKEKIIENLQQTVTLLPLRCEDERDTLDLFQILNDRGLPLSDTDIFKARMYQSISEGEEQKEFMKRWKALGGDENQVDDRKQREKVFKIYMHISRAEKKSTETTMKGIKDYMFKHHLKATGCEPSWKQIMETLSRCQWAGDNCTSDDDKSQADELIYWEILKRYPNVFWSYPFYVFLNKHLEDRGSEGFLLPNDEGIKAKYRALMRNTVRYFFIKGLARNTIDSIRRTTFRVCEDIHHGDDYTRQYHDNAKDDIDTVQQKLEESDIARYRNGLVFLNSLLNDNQHPVEYSKMMAEGSSIEHILPKKWNDYGGWDEESHACNLDRIGNLMPLEKRRNSKASNEFFRHKQKVYEKSKVQDAQDLAKKSPANWYPEDVEKRQQEAVERLMKFFRAPYE